MPKVNEDHLALAAYQIAIGRFVSEIAKLMDDQFQPHIAGLLKVAGEMMQDHGIQIVASQETRSRKAD